LIDAEIRTKLVFPQLNERVLKIYFGNYAATIRVNFYFRSFNNVRSGGAVNFRAANVRQSRCGFAAKRNRRRATSSLTTQCPDKVST